MLILTRRSFLVASSVMVATGPAFARSEAPMPPVRYVKTNGIRMAFYEAGTGPVVVLLHGFPEVAYSWRRQITDLAAAGYRVIAPDLRGYGLTDRPTAVEDYDLANLMGDLVGLLHALKIEKAVFMGHDWGGIIAWQMPLFHPRLVAGVIGVNTPFIPNWMLWLHPELTKGLAAPSFAPDPMKDPIAQMRQVYSSEMYVLMFQDGHIADDLMARDPNRTFRTVMRKDIILPSDYKKLAPEHHEMALFPPLGRPEPVQMPGKAILAPDALGFYTKTFEKTGFTPAINWYRNISRNWQAGLAVDQTVRVPSLMISAANDVILTPGMTDGMAAHVPDLAKVVIADCGHWTQEEKPAELSRAAMTWLDKRFRA